MAERYLESNLRNTLLELNQNEWKSKEKYFLQILKNSEGLNWKKLLNTNYKRFLNLLKKFFGIIDTPDLAANVNFSNNLHLEGKEFNFILNTFLDNALSRKDSHISANSPKNKNEIKFHSNSSPNLGNQINLFDDMNMHVPVANNTILQNMTGKLKFCI